MFYNVGDTVVYPMHGAGTIQDIEEKEVLGKLHKYYVMKMPYSDMKVMIPIDNIEGIGIRDVISRDEADKVIKEFVTVTNTVSTNWNKRFRENMVKIKSGNIHDVAAVLKSLMIRDREKGLSTGERKMLTNAKQIFISEIVMAKNISNDEVENILYGIVDEQLKDAR